MLQLSDLPQSLQSAELLSGNARVLGGSARPILMNNTPETRAQSIEIRCSQDVIISGQSAAWVWGSCRNLELPVELAVDSRRRVRFECPIPHTRRELIISDREITRLGGSLVTTPPRTAFELLRGATHFTTEIRRSCRFLLSLQPDGQNAIDDILASHPRTPHSGLVRIRLREMYGIDPTNCQ